MKKNQLIAELRKIATEHPHDVAGYVAEEALDQDCPETFFRDLLTHGCVSGMVGSLVYHYDTHAFFDQHYNEIEEMRYQHWEELGTQSIPGDLKNHLAWWAFELQAWEISEALGILD